MTRLMFWLVMSLCVVSPVWAECESQQYGDVTLLQLIPAEDQFFTICYDSRYEDDVEFTRTWLRKALEVGRTKYGVVSPTHREKPLHTVVFLTPENTSSTRPGYVVNHCCFEDGGRYITEIHYLTPSVWPDWTRYGVCFVNMEEYHAHYLVHEMIHTVQWSMEGERDSWTLEGLAEYDAYFHSTDWNRTGGVNNLIELADYSHRHRIWYAQSLDGNGKLGSENMYVGGAVIMMFYADQLGESVHAQFLRSSVEEVLALYGSRDWYGDLREWFDNREEHESYERCRSGA